MPLGAALQAAATTRAGDTDGSSPMSPSSIASPMPSVSRRFGESELPSLNSPAVKVEVLHANIPQGVGAVRRTPARKVVKKSKYYESPVSDTSSELDEDEVGDGDDEEASFIEKSDGAGGSSDDGGEGSFRVDEEEEEDDDDPLEYCEEDESVDEEFSGDEESDYDEE